jgi:hypothetical protein
MALIAKPAGNRKLQFSLIQMPRRFLVARIDGPDEAGRNDSAKSRSKHEVDRKFYFSKHNDYQLIAFFPLLKLLFTKTGRELKVNISARCNCTLPLLPATKRNRALFFVVSPR